MSKDIKYNKKCFEIYLSNKDIVEKIDNVTSEINYAYKEKKIHIIALLNGCIPTLERFLKNINIDYELNMIEVSSYNGMERGELNIDSSFDENFIFGENILIVDDIVDSGSTITKIKEKILNKSPLSNIKVFSLLSKRETNNICDWYCYLIPNKYVIGFGMDINNLFRELTDIYIMKD